MRNDVFRKILILAIIALFIASSHFSGTASIINQTNYFSNTGFSHLMLLRVNTSQNLNTLPSEVEIVEEKQGEWIDIIISDERLDELSDYNYEIIIPDVREYDNKVGGKYHTLAEIESILQNIANDYPDITSLYSIGTTYENRDILCLEITDNPGIDEGEPGIVFTGLHHADEWPSVEICLYFGDQLTSQYGSNQSITNIVNNRRLWLIPCVNPDGYNYDIQDYPDSKSWRKNRRYFPEFGTHGVDLNRNYEGSLNGDMWGAWGSIVSSPYGTYISHNPSNEHYVGPSPFSENETQAVAKIFLENDICASLTWHTSGERVLWPWAYSTDLTPDYSYIESIGTQIAQRITKMSGSGTYIPVQECYFTGHTGELTDWVYGYSHYIQGRPTLSYNIESCKIYVPRPDESHLDQICAENFDGAFYLLQEAENISKNMPSRVLPPIIDDMDDDSDGTYLVSWEEQNPEADPDHFQLDELTNLSCSIDDVDTGKQSLIWSYTTYSIVTSSPAVADGRVYVGSNDANIYCLNAENGTLIWKKYLFEYVRSSPAVADGRVYVGSGNQKVYCLNAENGDILWEFPTGNDVRSSPTVANGRVYIGSDDNNLYCLDADTGDCIWEYTTGGVVFSSPAVADDKVYFGSNDDNMYCLNAENGDILWEFPTGKDVRSSPVIADGRVYIGSGDMRIYCLNANNGTPIWNYTTKGIVDSSPAVANERVYVGSDDKNIYCFTDDHGDLIWVKATEGLIESSPVVADDKVYVGSSDKNIYCFSPSSLWFFDGFTISDSRNHSGNFSFYSGVEDKNLVVSSMRTTYPVPITKGMELSFCCWYDITKWDCAFVEVSKDGRCYDFIDSFSGSSSIWVYKNYSLDNYSDESIFIRFRYTTDLIPHPSESGFYVDDIMPIADFGTETTLSDSITSNQYNINGRSTGVYFYRVRGFNNERGWGDFSTLEGIYVGTTPPNKPVIRGRTSGKPGTEYVYTFSAKDPDNHNVSYFIKWGDGNSDGWTDYVESGTEKTLEHSWNVKGTYTIHALAKDEYGALSDCGTLEVTIPRNKPFNNDFNLLDWLFERFPLLERLLSLIRVL